MKIISSGIQAGYFLDCYGGYGDQFSFGEVPSYSIPFEIQEYPEETKTFAAVLYDLDAMAVTQGFPWIHWSLANLEHHFLVADASRQQKDFVQGTNSWHSPLVDHLPASETCFYGGMTPPDGDHLYTLEVFALDSRLDLENGFYLNQLVEKMQGHILARGKLTGKYRQYLQKNI